MGCSEAADPWAAGLEAVSSASDGRSPELVVLFSCDALADGELLAGAAEASGGAPLIGCSVPSDIGPGGSRSDRVLAMAIGGGGLRACTAVASSELGPRAAGRLASERLERAAGAGRDELVMLLTASQAGDQNEIVRGAYGVLGGSVPLVGGCTGKQSSAAPSVQLHNREVLLDAVVAASLLSDGPIGIGLRHGLSRVGERMVVTASDGGKVLELDGEPALDSYLGRLEAPAEAWSDPDAFTEFALAHPLGLSRSSGLDQARCISAAGFEDRSLLCVAEVPQGSLAWILHENVPSTIAAAEQACRDALDALHGAAPVGLLVFDCIGRRKFLGEDGAAEEVARLRAIAGDTPLAGFYTHGEIARTRGIRGFHNKTIVVLALG